MIDRETGALVLGRLRLSPGTRASALRGARREMGNGWVHVELGRHRLGALEFLVEASFERGRLDGYTLCAIDPRFGAGWDDADEPARRAAHDEWLAAALGERAKRAAGWSMPWGEAWSSLDPRTGGATIGVRFRRREKK